MIRLNDITSNLLSYLPKADINVIEKAYVYSAKVHHGQVRLSGETYLSHPLEVANILTKMKMDAISVTAGLLHDTIEDTDARLDDLERIFGKEVANIVNGVTKISKMSFPTSEERQAENMRKMILAMATDIRVIMVKLADRLHNMQTLGFQSPDKQELIAKETLEIYAPLAGRMGIYWLKSALEDLGLYYLEPGIYEKIKTELAERRGAREKFIEEVKEILFNKLKEAGISAVIKGRHKHFYSIYSKMKEQNVTVSQVYDILAFRVIVNSLKECYEVLGLIHASWKPVPGRFKDFISLPKANMYQSLHTTVIGPLGQRMEIQIRTWEMDRVAEEGIASHWRYKEGLISDKADEKQFAWLKQLLEWQKSLRDPKEFMESVRMDLFPNDVYVFTPKGAVKQLPKTATPVDFAYSIHSEVGNKCIGAKVNGKIVPLRYQLKNGDTVEIITSNKQHPSKDWLEFVKTSRARTKIHQWIMHQERDQSINLGKEMLDKALEQLHLAESAHALKEHLESIAKDFSYQSVEDLYANLGFGKLSVNQILTHVKARLGIHEDKDSLVRKMVARIRRKKSEHGIRVTGMDDMLVRFAKCCHPLPGERVVGFITRGRGVTVHQYNCRHILNVEPERIVDVVWEPTSHEVYVARLKITTTGKKGALAEISTIMSQKDANIIQAELQTTTDRKGVHHFTMEVENYNQFREIVAAVKRLKEVLHVERI
jgi:GTP pyrophosphokinase